MNRKTLLLSGILLPFLNIDKVLTNSSKNISTGRFNCNTSKPNLSQKTNLGFDDFIDLQEQLIVNGYTPIKLVVLPKLSKEHFLGRVTFGKVYYDTLVVPDNSVFILRNDTTIKNLKLGKNSIIDCRGFRIHILERLDLGH